VYHPVEGVAVAAQFDNPASANNDFAGFRRRNVENNVSLHLTPSGILAANSSTISKEPP
jgi:hypothetical protein